MKAKPLRFALALWAVTDCLAGCETKQQAASAPPPVEFVEVMQKDVPVATHSLDTGTSFCITSTNSTGGGADAACCFVSHPAKQSVTAQRARANRNGFAFMTHA